MPFSRNFEKISLWIIKIGLWLIPILPLYISSSMLFPFITGKNFAFRIIVEIIFAFWVVLAMLKSAYRPRLTPLFKAVSIFVMIVFLADIFSLNPWRAFFANYERMEGFMMLGHLYLYFIILSSVFKDRRDWLIFFHVTLVASLIVSFIALLQKFGYRVSLQGGFRVDSTIGNPTYLASYLVFHVWLLVMLLRKFWTNWWLRIVYTAVLFFELLIIYYTATRGAILALLFVSFLLVLVLFFFWSKVFPANRRLRPWALIVPLALILVPLIFWQFRSTHFVRSSQVLARLTQLSFQERTIQSRFLIWGMAYKATLERPVLGWGQENFYLVFQKYFNPGLYAQEPWFDRSHNIFFDWLVHTGFLGLAGYFSILGAAFWTLISSMRKNTVPTWEGLILLSLFSAHFLQNFFVFDNLNTYLLFFAFLAYTQYLESPLVNTVAGKVSKPVQASSNLYFKAQVTIAALLAAVFFFGYFLHWKPIQESRALTRALSLAQSKAPMDQVLGAFAKALNYHTFGDTEVREQMANFARSVPGNDRFTPQEKIRFVDFAVQELKKETSSPAKDVKHLLFLAAVLGQAQSLNPQYGLEAEKLLQEAIQISPTKQIIYFELAQLYLAQGKTDQVIEVLRKAWYLDKNFQNAGLNLWVIGLAYKKPEVVAEVREVIKIKEIGNSEALTRLGSIYQQQGDLATALEIADRLVETVPDNPNHQATYGSLLAYFKRKDEAIKHLQEALRLNPNLKEVQQLLDQLKLR